MGCVLCSPFFICHFYFFVLKLGNDKKRLLAPKIKIFFLSVFNFKKYMVASFKKPLSIFQAKKKLSELSPYGFLIAIEYIPSDLNFKKMIDEISEAYNYELPFKNSDKYNFKRGLR